MIYYIVYFTTKVISWIFFPFTAYQTRNIPRHGAFILASNHISNLDPVLLGISSVRRLNFMAKIELFKGALGFILTQLGSFPVKRGMADLGAMKEALRRLEKGRPILIFVEGTRRIGNGPRKAQAGVGFLATKSGMPIVPVYVQGTDLVMPPGAKMFKRHPVSVIYGEPFYVREGLEHEQAAQYILDKVYALGPNL